MGRRLLPVAVVAAITAMILLAGWHRHLSLETLVRHRAVIDAFIADHGAVALVAFAALYVMAAALAVPGITMLTITGGALFGCLAAGLAVMAGGTAGATLIFLLARSACGEAVAARAGPRLAKIAEGIKADAFSYLLFLRLVPLFPFWLVNLAPAIVGVKLRTFVSATALGIIPGTFTFTLVGAGLDSMIRLEGAAYRACLAAGRSDCRLGFDPHAALTPQLLAGLGALGVLALIPMIIKHRRVRARLGR